jgi:hypothetical protein
LPKMLTELELKARKVELDKEIAAAFAKLKPLQAERDAMVARYDPPLRELSNRIKKMTADLKLFELQNELGAVTRAMKKRS